jgi:hypothetical protein
MRSEVFRAVKIYIEVFCVMPPSYLVGGYLPFGGNCHLRTYALMMSTAGSSETRLHFIIAEKTAI